MGLDKICGDPNFKDLCVRVSEKGDILFVEDFEDGSYADLFELREYKPSRVQTRAKEKAVEADVEQLQTGRKYLCTVGRTNRFFGASPSEIINSCFRDEEGAPKVFPAF